MNSVKIFADIPKQLLGPEPGYERTVRLTQALSSVLPGPTRWYGGIVSPKDTYLPFEDRTAILERIQRKWPSPDDPPFFGVGTNPSLKGRTPGELGLLFMPETGTIHLDIEAPDKAFGANATNVCRDLLIKLVETEPVSFAYVDVFDPPPGEKLLKSYGFDFATFPHRKCLGWMGFVPQVVTAEQLPLAAELVPVPGKGTVIVAVNEPFDLNNMQHIQRANQIEMDMVDHDLLPVTDPSFL